MPRGNYEAAVAHFTEGVRLDPGFAGAHYNLGVALQKKGSYQAAEVYYAEAARLEPHSVDAHELGHRPLHPG